jgi:hypothetical protein
MKTLMYGFAMSLAVVASGAQADQVLTVDGEVYFLSALVENCQNITDDPAGQVACFNSISTLMAEQAPQGQADAASVTTSLDALRAAAEYQDDDSGLSIFGSDCSIQIVYFDNYFHISRRNISELDLISAQFDASKLQMDQTGQIPGTQTPLLRGMLQDGAVATTHGAFGLESSLQNFTPRSPRTTLDAYAIEVIAELEPVESQSFDFVLIHPQRGEAAAEIWGAFQDFATVCKG